MGEVEAAIAASTKVLGWAHSTLCQDAPDP